MYVAFEHFIAIGDDPRAVAISQGVNTRAECMRITRYAFEYALKHGRKRVTIVHKANVLKALTGLFLECGQIVAQEFEGRIEMDDRIVDACAMQLVMNPWQFDVIVTTNLFGDILSDQLAGLVGGLGMAPGANIGPDAAIFEAVHGSAPDIAGKGLANPLALLLAACLMLEHVGHFNSAARIRKAMLVSLNDDGVRTADLGGKASTGDFAKGIIRRLGLAADRDSWRSKAPAPERKFWRVEMPKGSDLLVAALENEGVDRIFGVPGEENLDVVESLRNSSIKLILTRHEQGAAFMAATYGRLTGKPGVCITTLGPGRSEPDDGSGLRSCSALCRWSCSPGRRAS